MKDPETDRRTELALFRCGVIAEALHLPASEVAGALARQSEKEWSIPGLRRRRIAAQTMRDWCCLSLNLGSDLSVCFGRTGTVLSRLARRFCGCPDPSF